MFELSTKTHYGVAALLDLAKAYNKELIQIKTIVEKRSIPKSYLEQIFNRLSKDGIVKSVRGNRGGYLIGKDPAKITLFEICEVLEGSLNIQSEKSITITNHIFGKAEDEIRKVFDITLQELAEKENDFSETLMYYI